MAHHQPLHSITINDIEAVQGISAASAAQLHRKLTEILATYGADATMTWQHISRNLLTPELPFAFHQMMYYSCYFDYGLDPPVWLPDPIMARRMEGKPSVPEMWVRAPPLAQFAGVYSKQPLYLNFEEAAKLTNIGKLLERRGKELLGPSYKNPISSFSDFQEFTVSNLEMYWKIVFEEMNISFSVSPECILRETPLHPGGQWLPGARLNPAKLLDVECKEKFK
ncbi:hypothetical protein FXO37_06531 [Capsicum annuum]|nr:hypothetical protein FXO37_06531 [Capsicum annuum]